MKTTCNIIRDLLPLYRDGVCSPDSSGLVEEHLSSCESCREELKAMEAALASPHIDPEAKQSLASLARSWKQGRVKAFLRGGALALLLCALLAGVFTFLTQWNGVSIPKEKIIAENITWSEEEQVLRFDLTVHDQVKRIHWTLTEDGSYYVTPQRSILVLGNYTGQQGRTIALYPPEAQGPLREFGWPVDEGTRRIYLGPVGDGILLWEAES